MEEVTSAHLTPKLNHRNGTNGMSRKKSPRHTLTNGLEENEAILVAEGTAFAAHRFHNELGALQGHSKRCRTPAPPTNQPLPQVTYATAAVIVKPEPLRTALMEVNEEDEEMEAQHDRLKVMSNGIKLSREAFLERAREILTRPESLMSVNPTSPVHFIELKEALSTALARNARLKELRQSQISRYLQLQRRAECLSTDLDASVDNLRHQKARWEAEKRRLLVEARELRLQLAEALAAAAHNSTKLSNGPNHAGGNGSCLECEKRNLEIPSLKIAIERLEDELVRQRRTFEQDCANISVQLADAAAENRSLRLQHARSSAVTMVDNSNTLSSEITCIGCKRLQKLVDVLQKKNSSSFRNSILEVATQTETPFEVIENPDAEDCDGKSLFVLLESRGRTNDLTTEYLEQQPCESLRTSPQKSTVKTPAPRTLIPSLSKNVNTAENEMTKTPDVSKLLERLKNLEAEAQSSADQLRSSNDEFLQLRERLTNATIEKAHLKAQLDASNDRILQFESDLSERNQELRRFQSKLLEYQKPQDCVLRFEDRFCMQNCR